jgi:hypothetical protein
LSGVFAVLPATFMSSDVRCRALLEGHHGRRCDLCSLPLFATRFDWIDLIVPHRTASGSPLTGFGK